MTTATAQKPKRAAKVKANCPECGAVQNRHVSTCSQCENRCEAAIEGERCEKFAGHDLPHEHAGTGGTLTWGYPSDDFDAPQTVAGVEAKIVVDGVTGEVKQVELLSLPIEDRIREIGRKEAQLDDARSEKKLASERVKALEEEHEMLVRDLVRYVQSGEMPLPFTAAQDARESADEAQELTAAERRALRMAQEPQAGEQAAVGSAAQTEMLSQQKPGVYVAEGDGPEE